MGKPYRKFLAELRQITSSFSISYLRKWLPAAILIGIASGVASIAFFLAITWATKLFLGFGAGFAPPASASVGETMVTEIGRRWMIPVITTIGGLISGFIVYKFAPEAEGAGVNASIDAFHHKGGVVPARVPLIKLAASATIIGSGGSAGTQGPMAQISAGLGSLVSRLFRFNAHDRRLAVAVGIGAGVGSIFKAPLGGAILAAEILYLEGFETEALIPSFIATITGYSIFASWQGFTPIFGEHLAVAFHDPKSLISYAILGILCGLTGILYSRTFYGVRNFFHRLKIPNYYKPAIGGLVTGLIGLALPQVLGLGYGWLQLAMEPGKLALAIMIALVFAKIAATSFSIGSGGSGGIFAPALMTGGMLAAFLWAAIYPASPAFLPSSPEPFVVVGMLALFGAIAHAPIAAILMVSEMSGTYTMVAPAMLAIVLACIIVGSDTLYKSQVLSPAVSPAHKYEYISPLLRTMQVKQAMVTSFPSLHPEASLEKADELIQSYKMSIPVMDINKQIVGIVAGEDILPIPQELRGLTRIASVMSTKLVVIYPEETLEQALEIIVARRVASLPVVDKKKPTKLLGLLTRSSIIKAYESEAKKMLGGSMNSG